MSTEVANPSPQNPLSKDGSPRGGGSPSSLPQSVRAQSMKKASTLSLPILKNNSMVVDKSKPLPTSLQSDFIPQDVLLSLTMPAPPAEQLGPPSRYRNLNTSSGPAKKRASNVWNYKGQRDKLKHLTENTICVCGAGKDISFLYDVPNKAESKEKPAMFDQSAPRLEQAQEGKEKLPLQLPDTLIPEEYHIVKNKGVLGLEYYDDEFSTKPSDHEKHLVMFPSMNPTSRYEVLQLKKTLSDMMTRIGVDEILELEGARETQLHNLLELIKKEQDIYNVVFHEIIRQVTVDCVERGELLSAVRRRYHDLLNRVPKQVKSLHEEVMAQRALDRRLTEELMRFKNTIGILTNELSQVKDHDLRVSSAAHDAQGDLKHALAESQKNSSLLAEYHDLYELQRNRLELQVNMLTDEKELWSTAAYSLALKVTEEYNLQTAKRLHISEKAWQKLANHFTILLSDQDTGVLTKLQAHIDSWRDLSEVFNFTMKRRDEAMRDTLTMIKREMEEVRIDFRKIHMSEGIGGREGNIMKLPDKEKVAEYYDYIKSWEEMLSRDTEKFGGDIMLSMQEELTKIKHEMYGWTDAALKVFNRHRGEDGSNYPDHDAMLKMNESVEELVKQYQVRLTGDNGVARGFIHLSNVLETWDTRLNTVLHGSNPLPDAEWSRFYQLLEDWINGVDETYACIGLTQKEEDRVDGKQQKVVEYIDAVKLTQRWVSSATNGIDSEDAKLVEYVAQLHTEMVKWMVQMLLRLAPDMEQNSAEAREMVLLGSTSVSDLQTNAKSLFERLDSFTRYVILCCNNIVKDAMQKKVDVHEDNADYEFKELQNLKSESDEWIQTAILLLHELTGETIEFRPATSSVKVSESKAGKDVAYSDHDKLSVLDTSRTRLTSATGGARSDMGFSDYGHTDRSGQESSQGMGGISPRSESSDIPASEKSRHVSESSRLEAERSRHVSEKSDIALSGGGLTPVPTGPAEEPAKTPEPSEQQDIVDGPTPAIPFDSIKQASSSPSLVPPPADPSPVPPGESSQSPVPPSVEPSAISLSNVREEADKQDEAAAAPAAGEPEREEPTNEPMSLAESPERVQAIGYDKNTHFKSLEQSPDQPPSAGGPQLPESRQETPNAQKAYEALAAVETLQFQLISAEERAQVAEERCHTMEEELNKALESIRALERKLAPSTSAESGHASTSKSCSDIKGTATASAKLPETSKSDWKIDKGHKEKRSDSQASVKSSVSKSSMKSHKKK